MIRMLTKIISNGYDNFISNINHRFSEEVLSGNHMVNNWQDYFAVIEQPLKAFVDSQSDATKNNPEFCQFLLRIFNFHHGNAFTDTNLTQEKIQNMKIIFSLVDEYFKQDPAFWYALSVSSDTFVLRNLISRVPKELLWTEEFKQASAEIDSIFNNKYEQTLNRDIAIDCLSVLLNKSSEIKSLHRDLWEFFIKDQFIKKLRIIKTKPSCQILLFSLEDILKKTPGSVIFGGNFWNNLHICENEINTVFIL